jgi:hypothetical protein
VKKRRPELVKNNRRLESREARSRASGVLAILDIPRKIKKAHR